MTKEEARIVILEDALVEAQNIVEFLHNCLINPQYHTYEYPGQTLQKLNELSELVPSRYACYHSFTQKDCKACQDRNEHMTKLMEARQVLSE